METSTTNVPSPQRDAADRDAADRDALLAELRRVTAAADRYRLTSLALAALAIITILIHLP